MGARNRFDRNARQGVSDVVYFGGPNYAESTPTSGAFRTSPACTGTHTSAIYIGTWCALQHTSPPLQHGCCTNSRASDQFRRASSPPHVPPIYMVVIGSSFRCSGVKPRSIALRVTMLVAIIISALWWQSTLTRTAASKPSTWRGLRASAAWRPTFRCNKRSRQPSCLQRWTEVRHRSCTCSTNNLFAKPSAGLLRERGRTRHARELCG